MTPPDEIERAVEAALFAADEPLSTEALSTHLGGAEVAEALHALAGHYAERGVRLVERGGCWQFQTAPDLAHLLRREREQVRRLSRAATEVLAIVAYHEPVSRAEIEAIRGVQTSPGTLDVLMEAGWVRVTGRREVPGRPVIYATTLDFLSHFGLASRKDLPGIDELKAAGLLDPVDDAIRDFSDEAGGVRDDTAPAPGSGRRNALDLASTHREAQVNDCGPIPISDHRVHRARPVGAPSHPRRP